MRTPVHTTRVNVGELKVQTVEKQGRDGEIGNPTCDRNSERGLCSVIMSLMLSDIVALKVSWFELYIHQFASDDAC